MSFSACDSDNNSEEPQNNSLLNMTLADVMTTSENGDSVTISVSLGAQPNGSVTFSLSSDNPKEGVVSPSKLTFNAENWNTPQTFTVTGVADGVADGDQKYHVILSVLSTDDIAFADLSKTVSLTNLDADKDLPPKPVTAGIHVVPERTLLTYEDKSESDSFTVALNTAPKSGVTLNLTATPATECAIDKTKLSFDETNWDKPITVTVTGIDDDEKDGNQVCNITMTSESADADYNQLAIEPVRVVNVDDDFQNPLKLVSFMHDEGGVETDEYGSRGYFLLQLWNKPAFDVHVQLEVSRPDEVYLETQEVVITPELGFDWVEVPVTGLDDNTKDGDQPFEIKIVSVKSEDPLYNDAKPFDYGEGVYSDTIKGVNRDNEGLENANGLIVKQVSPKPGKMMRDLQIDAAVSEKGETALYSVRLKSKPKNNTKVFVTGLVTDPTEGLVEPMTYAFDSENWDTPTTFKIHGLDDDEIDGDVIFGVRFITYSDDLANNDLKSDTFILKNIDDDGKLDESYTGALIIRKQHDILYTSEDGTTRSIFLSLNRQPSDDVKVFLQGSNLKEGRYSNLVKGINVDYEESKPYMTFTSLDWNIEKELVIQGVDDDIADGTQEYQFDFKVVSNDPSFNNIEVEPVKCLNYDNEEAPSVQNDVYEPNSDMIVVKGINPSDTNMIPDDGLTFYVSLGKKPEKGRVPITIRAWGEKKGLFNIFVDGDTIGKTSAILSIDAEDWAKLHPVTIRPNTQIAKDGSAGIISMFVPANTCKDHSFNDLALDPFDIQYRASITKPETPEQPSWTVDEPEDTPEPVQPRLEFSPNICNSIGLVSSNGNSQKYAVRLQKQPKNNVKVTFSIPEEYKDSVKFKNNKFNLTFKPSDYNAYQYIEVIGIDDNSTETEVISLNYTMESTDNYYNGDDPNACELKLYHAANEQEFKPNAPKTRKLRIMSANTTTSDAQLYEEPGMNMFYAMDPDIILIQEFAKSADDVVSKLKEHFHTDYHYYVGRGGIGNGIIVKGDLKIKETYSMRSVVPSITDRQYEAAIIDLPGDKDMIAVSLHLYTKCNDENDVKAEQEHPSQLSEYPAVAEFIQSILNTGDYYVAVGGDFNSKTNQYVNQHWSSLLATNITYPRDQEGNYNTNAARRWHYDWVLVDPKFQTYSVPTVIGDQEYPYGYVLDSRVQNPLSYIAPVTYGDSSAPKMQHMPVVRDFVIEY